MDSSLLRVGIVTGTRADYGLLSRFIKLIESDNRFISTVFVTGTHLSPEYGYTINELTEEGVNDIVPVEILLSSNSRTGIAKTVGLATISFADAFSYRDLDVVLVLGDRYEILAAAQTAMLLGIPLIHVHGGEITEGAFDDSIRHAVSKMANIHFVSTRVFANRIRQMGEIESSIFIVGALGIDNILNFKRMTKDELEDSLKLDVNKPIALVTYHTVTNTRDKSENDIAPLISSIKENPQLIYVITYPNADGDGKSIIKQWESLSGLGNVILVPSLGFKRYLSLMRYVDCVVGNSSSGIIEAPSFKIGTINIGTRQKGRPTAMSVINVNMDKVAISEAISKCCSDKFKKSLGNMVNPYGVGGAAEKMVEIISELEINSFKVKTFQDI
jgi:UDP-hydrolysing UDP-N-acetyl-D-glucosamine 2-epimerase